MRPHSKPCSRRLETSRIEVPMTGRTRTGGWLLCVASVLAAAWGCSASLPHANDQDVAWAGQHWSGASRAELETGRDHYVRSCGSCHNLKLPGDLPPDRWEPEVRRMTTTHKIKLSESEQQQIIRYLVTLSSQHHAPNQQSSVQRSEL